MKGDFHIGSGAAAGRAYLAATSRPTAVFATSDEMAIGFMTSVRAGGLRVPEDVSVVGMDGIAFGEHVHPRLTTVVQPQAEMAEAAVDMLLRLIDVEQAVTCPPFATELRSGASTAPPPARREDAA